MLIVDKIFENPPDRQTDKIGEMLLNLYEAGEAEPPESWLALSSHPVDESEP